MLHDDALQLSLEGLAPIFQHTQAAKLIPIWINRLKQALF